MKNVILIESNPDFADNSKALFDKLIEKKINERIKIIWIVKDDDIFQNINIKNVYFYKRSGNIFNKFRFLYYNIFSKYIIDCNRYILKMNKNQFRIHLTHGAPIKDVDDYFSTCGKVDYILTLSDYFFDYYSKAYKINKSQLLSYGLPRNDYLYKFDKDFYEMFKNDDEKIVIWLPTFRNGKTAKYYCGLPCINSFDELTRLNELLVEYKIKLLIKFHPLESIDILENLNLENIRIIKDDIFILEHKNLYQLLSVCDALITDYSSVYFDFLLTKKRIGLAIPDYKLYSKVYKLSIRNIKSELEGDFIYNYDDLLNFFINIYKEKEFDYNKSLNKYHKYIDGNTCERVYNLFYDRINNNE